MIRHRILKYTLWPATRELPGTILTVAWQGGDLRAWCDVADPAEPVGVVVLPTGADISVTIRPPLARYVGSAVSDELVFHVWEFAL